MSLRVTTNVIVERSIRDINAGLLRLQKLQSQISSGKRILKPSDDPVDASKSIRLTEDLSKIGTYQTNIRDGLNRLKATERVLEDVLKVILDIQGTAQEGLAVSSSVERGTLSANIDSLLQQMLQNVNSKFQGRFIFGGMETLSGTAPLSAPFNAVYDVDGNISGVVQNPDGINSLINYEISQGRYTPVNISGAAPFQPNGSKGVEDVFQTMIDLRDAFLTGDLPTASQELNSLRREYDTIISQASIVGTRINAFENSQNQQADLSINLKEVLSATIDVDLAQAIIEESYQQYLYNASLQVGARIIPNSLLDFI